MTALLGPSHIAMVAKGVSAIVASRDAALRPSIMRAVGSHISGDGQEVTVYLRRSQSEQLLQDIAHTGEIAVVFSVPSTHQTLQLKARRATQRPAHDGDLPVLQAYLQSMVQEVGQVGYGPQYVAAMLAAPLQGCGGRELHTHPCVRPDTGPARRRGVVFATHVTLTTYAAAMSTAAPSLHSIRPCLEGAIPAIMATCDPDGTPNVAYISQVVYVDAAHVALSFQFFNKTRQNILRNPRASVLVLDPLTAHFYRLHLLYERTEDSGPVFESMRAQLAGIASHSGMAEVFELKGADIYAVEHIESVAGEGLPAPAPRAGLLHTLRLCSESIARCTGLDELLQGALQGLQHKLGIQHAMVLMLDASAQQLYTVASTGAGACCCMSDSMAVRSAGDM